jgi:ribosomal protein S18 acetylase RimI-like enzyme
MCAIRRATSADAPGILACLGAAFEDYRDLYTPEAFLDTVLTPKTLQERLEKMAVFVATDSGNQIVGTIACVVLTAEEGHLRGMAVFPSMRGTGIAEELLNHAESELRSCKCRRITLDTTELLQRAMRFYEKRGYSRSGKITDFLGMRLIEHYKSI